MLQNKQNEKVTEVAKIISEKLQKYEILLAVLVVVEILIKATISTHIQPILVMTLSTLAILYYFNGFTITYGDTENGLEIFLFKIGSFASSVGIMGILFLMANWPGNNYMILVGCVTVLLILPVLQYLKTRRTTLKHFSQRIVIRLLIIGLVGLSLLFTPKEVLYKIGIIHHHTEVKNQ